jgi:ribosomal protein S18 acetylase RimI-like enzyme
MSPTPQGPSNGRSQPVPSLMPAHGGTAEHSVIVHKLQTSEEIANSRQKLARWVHATSPQYFDFIFGDADCARWNLEHWICRDNSEFSGKFCYLLTVDGASAGCLIALPGAEVASRRRADTLALIKNCSSTNRPKLMARLASIQTTLASVMADELYIRCLSVDPAYRGRGLGEIFLQDVINQSMGIGIGKFRLDVEAGNAAALGLYSKLGFAVAHSGRLSPLDMVVYSMTLILKPA